MIRRGQTAALAAILIASAAQVIASDETHGALSADDADRAYIRTRTDTVPNLAYPFTTASVASGRWSDPTVWSNRRVPGDGDVVRITTGTRIAYDRLSDARLRAVGVAGDLLFDTARNTRIRVTHLLVYRSGYLEIGRADAPVPVGVTAEIIINDEPLDTGTPEAPGLDPEQYGNGLLVWGRLSLNGAARTPPFVRLARAPAAGESELLLEAPPLAWRAGDEVVLPDSRQPVPQRLRRIDRAPYNETGSRGVVPDPQWETARITHLDGARATLAAPLRYDHPGVRGTSNASAVSDGPPMLPHVADVTRNVIIRSENASGVRGHTICFRDARAHVVNTAFVDLGRTTAAPLDSTRFDDGGQLVHVGANQIARYPIHMHHLVDADRVTGSAPEFELSGNVVRGALRWGIAVHASHFGLIAGNIIMDLDGAGIVTEDGSESGNRFEHNFVTAVRGSGLPADARRRGEGLGHEGAGFWFGSDNNVIIGNVAAGVRDGGISLFRSEHSLPFPTFPSLQSTDIALLPDGSVRVAKLDHNEVYGSAGAGIELWSTKACSVCRAHDVMLKDTVVWNTYLGLVYDYHSDYYVVDGLVVQGSRPIAKGSTGVTANNSLRARVSGAKIKDMDIGLEGGGSRNRELQLSNATITANTGLIIRRGTSWGSRKPVVLRNVSISPPNAGSGTSATRLIALEDEPYRARQPKRMLPRPIQVYAFQGQPGNNFALFYPDQAAGALVPQSNDPAVGCPEPGLTNRQCLDRYGLAVGGAVASCEEQLPGVDGFACPLTGPGAADVGEKQRD